MTTPNKLIPKKQIAVSDINTSELNNDAGYATEINGLTDGYTGGTNNMFLGGNGGSTGSLDSNNTAIGVKALDSLDNSGSSYNTAIGPQAGEKLTTGDYNTLIGPQAGQDLISGVNNIAFGRLALGDSTTGGNNVAIGYLTGQKLDSQRSVAIGVQASRLSTAATDSVAIGYQAGAGVSGTTGGSRNTFIGSKSGLGINTGYYNTCIGYGTGDSISTGYRNILLGYDVDVSAPGAFNELNIGNTITGNLSTGEIAIPSITYNTSQGGVLALGNLGSTETLNWSAATHFSGTLDSNVTITHSNETGGQSITLYLSGDGTQRTASFSSVDIWLDSNDGSAPVMPTATTDRIVITMQKVGTEVYASATGNYAVY